MCLEMIDDGHDVTIHINGVAYRISGGAMSAVELRALPSPPLDAETHLYQAGGSGEDDRFLGGSDQIEVVDGMQFFTAPATITAG
jgi:hypothetical protein